MKYWSAISSIKSLTKGKPSVEIELDIESFCSTYKYKGKKTAATTDCLNS